MSGPPRSITAMQSGDDPALFCAASEMSTDSTPDCMLTAHGALICEAEHQLRCLAMHLLGARMQVGIGGARAPGGALPSVTLRSPVSRKRQSAERTLRPTARVDAADEPQRTDGDIQDRGALEGAAAVPTEACRQPGRPETGGRAPQLRHRLEGMRACTPSRTAPHPGRRALPAAAAAAAAAASRARRPSPLVALRPRDARLPARRQPCTGRRKLCPSGKASAPGRSERRSTGEGARTRGLHPRRVLLHVSNRVQKAETPS